MYFRDFGLPVWDTIYKYSAGIANIFYDSDNRVKEDIELQNWAMEISVAGARAK